MKVKITATAPTSYQYGSIRHFNLPIKSHGSGSHTIEENFDSIKEAKEYLTTRAENYFDTKRELKEANREIKRGYLQLDAVTAFIEPIN